MLNQVVMVGRLVRDPEVEELENGKKKSYMTLAVQRSYKNAEGIYDTDFIDITLWDGIASNTAEYCHKGDIVGVKARVKTEGYEVDGETHKKTEIVAEKVTFLTTSKDKNKEEKSDSKEEDYEM